jgi:hypothetical protein
MFNLAKTTASTPLQNAKKTIYAKFVSFIAQSAITSSKISSTRIQTYIMMLSVILSTAAFVGIELTNAFIAWLAGTTYIISSESIIIFGMILSHHLGMMFSKPKAYDAADFESRVAKIDEKVETKIRSKKSKPQASPAQAESDETATYI